MVEIKRVSWRPKSHAYVHSASSHFHSSNNGAYSSHIPVIWITPYFPDTQSFCSCMEWRSILIGGHATSSGSQGEEKARGGSASTRKLTCTHISMPRQLVSRWFTFYTSHLPCHTASHDLVIFPLLIPKCILSIFIGEYMLNEILIIKIITYIFNSVIETVCWVACLCFSFLAMLLITNQINFHKIPIKSNDIINIKQHSNITSSKVFMYTNASMELESFFVYCYWIFLLLCMCLDLSLTNQKPKRKEISGAKNTSFWINLSS